MGAGAGGVDCGLESVEEGRGIEMDSEYLGWEDAGGPNECEHGYADGLRCPYCDWIEIPKSEVETPAK